jgi:peptidoglycan/xylan/chitin deacetylase (PgdA/CDA1 family)
MDSAAAQPSPLRQLVRRGMTAALPRRMFMTSGPPDSRGLALTFDDGPDPVHTPAVLDRLRALGARATFFVIGAKAEAYPGLVTRMADDGHEVGHHSFSHGPPSATSAFTLVSEARRTAALIARLVGAAPRLFRPPHGKLTPAKTLGLWAARQTIVLWNKDPKDFACGSTEEVRGWFEREPLAGGDIVLLHDVHARIAPALEVVVDRARRLGLSFATPADWISGGG